MFSISYGLYSERNELLGSLNLMKISFTNQVEDWLVERIQRQGMINVANERKLVQEQMILLAVNVSNFLMFPSFSRLYSPSRFYQRRVKMLKPRFLFSLKSS